ncbi:hypothetical protein BDV32DRAFT_155797 [Aspergillus pseudonomiae]|nr:hypothetical protein BDV32DRAFT_155797 [Aspergillus pseudonomiae]
MSSGFVPSAPGCLVSGDFEAHVTSAKEAATAAVEAIVAAQDSLQLVGPLRGPAGARLSSQEQHTGLHTSQGHMEGAIESLEDTFDSLHAAINLMAGHRYPG